MKVGSETVVQRGIGNVIIYATNMVPEIVWPQFRESEEAFTERVEIERQKYEAKRKIEANK